MKLTNVILIACFALPVAANAYDGRPSSPKLYSGDGKFLGNANANRYDPNSVANPYGKYGSRYSEDSVNNPYGRYGSRYSPESANNPYVDNGRALGSTLGSTLGGSGGIGSTFNRD
jgi:hypothetical protein